MTIKMENEVAELNAKWAQLYAESAMLQYDITCDDIHTSVLTESVSDYEADVLTEGAISDLAVSIAEAIKKLFEGVCKFLKNIGEKIVSFVKGEKVKETLPEINAMKKDPEAKAVKVEVDDIESGKKTLAEYKAIIKKCKMKLKSGKPLTDAELKDLEDAKAKCKSPVKKIIVGAVIAAAAAGTAIVGMSTTEYALEYKDCDREYEAAMAKAQDVHDRMVGADKKYYDDLNRVAQDEAQYAKMDAQMKLREGNIYKKCCSALARFFTGTSDISDGYSRKDLDKYNRTNKRSRETLNASNDDD